MGDMMVPALLLVRGDCVIKTVFVAKNLKHASEMERSVSVGRSRICDVALVDEHLSVADLHLLLEVDCNLRTLHVTDLGTEFGTWICGERLEPHEKQVLEEDGGALIRLGNSPRSYKLQWLPLDCSIDKAGLYVPRLMGSVAIFGGAKFQQTMTVTTKLWYVVADVSCLLVQADRGVLQVLRTDHLHTQLWIPFHVVSELGRLQMENYWLAQLASDALHWIHTMLAERMPWIHLQAPGERVSINVGDPSHVLECGLFLKNNKTPSHGGVVIVTNDTGLLILGKSIGFECETVHSYVMSLYDSYSRRCLHPPGF